MKRLSKVERLKARAKYLYDKGWRATDISELFEMMVESGEVDPQNAKYVHDIIDLFEEFEKRDIDFLFSSGGIFN